MLFGSVYSMLAGPYLMFTVVAVIKYILSDSMLVFSESLDGVLLLLWCRRANKALQMQRHIGTCACRVSTEMAAARTIFGEGLRQDHCLQLVHPQVRIYLL